MNLFPPKPTNCGPIQSAARFVRAKFPAPSEIAVPVQPVELPPPSRPSIDTTTPASGVSCAFETTVRPRNEVVGAITASCAVADCEIGTLLATAAAVTVMFDVLSACALAAVNVATAVCPAATTGGLILAVIPCDRPARLNVAEN